MPSMNLRADQRQSQTLSPRLQRAVRLLQMSSMDFASMLRDTLGTNPFLEVEDGDGDEAAGASSELPNVADENYRSDDDTGSDAMLSDRAAPAAADALDERNDRDLWQANPGTGSRQAGDGEISALELVAVETPLNAHLHGQLNLLKLSPRELVLTRTLVESLDDDGYLRTPLEELIDVAALAPAATQQELLIALSQVQSLEPAGVGARGVGECLQLQLQAFACAQMRALAQTIVESHLPALAARDPRAPARELGEAPALVGEVCDRIRRLDPRPGWRLSSSHIAYIVPDVIVKKVRGKWIVQLNAVVVPKVRLNQVYEQLFQRHRSAENTELGEHLQEARWTLRNVEQRFSTILDVAEAIVSRQQNFLEHGAMAMRPLGLNEIAEELGVHESTVSRVTNNKYMSTPNGVYELKYFFSRAMATAAGGACSGTAIRELIKDIIEAESPHAPLNDVEIARQLGEQGLLVARRTVTKYRQLLHIDVADRRRRQPTLEP